MISRRHFVLGSAAFAGLAGGPHAPSRADDHALSGLADHFAGLERESGGRLGVAVLDTKTGRSAAHRETERFPLTSTFKLLAASAVLARIDAGQTQLEERVVFAESDLVAYSPATKSRVGGEGMSLGELCEAAITLSDNTAGNLLLRVIGGSAGLTAYARTLGDPVTRLDRIEPELNEALSGDVRDTTAPGAMLSNLQKLALGDALSPASRDKLVAWLKANKTGNERMRARLPKGWTVGDKTGLGEHGSTNDVGIIWPPDNAPILLAIYLTNTDKPIAERAAIIQEIGRLVASAARG
jgi:beta-lactamase class A